MQTSKTTTDVLGQFDALGVLSQDTGAVETWAKPFSPKKSPTIQGSISRWWIQKGVTEVASARDVSMLSELAFQFETWAPRLA